MLVSTSPQQNKLKVLGSIPLYSFVCLICKTLHNLHCFASAISFQHLVMSLCHNLPILNFQLVVPPLYMCSGPHKLKIDNFPLISLLSSTYFVKIMNNGQDYCNLIGWIDSRDNRIGGDQSACAAQKPIKAGIFMPKFHSEPCF